MAFKLTTQDILEAALFGSLMGVSKRYSAAPSAAGSPAETVLSAVSRMVPEQGNADGAGPSVTGAPGQANAGNPGGTIHSVGGMPGGVLTEADIMQIRSLYGAKEYPRKDHVVRTERANGTHNSGLSRNVAEDASRMQNMDFHNDTLFKYLRPGMDQKQAHEAIKRGYKEEMHIPAYWDDFRPRRDMHVHSDAVHAIRITPDARIEIKWRGKPSKNNPSGWYTFRQFPDTHAASMAAKELIMSDSLGHAVFPFQRNGKPIKVKPGWSWWNRKNYDGAMAG